MRGPGLGLNNLHHFILYLSYVLEDGATLKINSDTV